MMGLILIYVVISILILGLIAVIAYVFWVIALTLFGDFIEKAIKIKEARKWDRKED